MCGICGVLGLPTAQGREAVESMLPWIRHRGPDGEGVFVDDGVALGHTRLAIRGLTQGSQPLVDEFSALVFNGEIYGEDVEARLDGKQISDTDLVFSLLKGRGSDALEAMEGMFALAFWDGRRRSCLLARDRAGEKPLYVAHRPGGVLFFASELRALVAGLGFLPSTDTMGLHYYLSFGFVPSPGTILEGVQQIEPGAFVLWQEGRGSREGKYWSIFDLVEENSGPVSTPGALLETLHRSVGWRLRADVPAGLLVSGGVDSAAVASLASREAEIPPPCFSLGFEEAGYDELRWAETVVSRLGLRHFQRRLSSPEIPALAREALAAMDGPMGDPSWIPSFALAKLASQEVKVALGGDGADELFGGYQAFSFESLAQFFEGRNWIPVDSIARFVARFSPSTGYRTPRYAIHQFLKGLEMPCRQRHFVWLGAWTPEAAASLLDRREWNDEEFWSFLPEERPGVDSGNFLLAHYFRYYLGECLLVKSDRASMAHGLEIRSPFLDSRMVGQAMQIPYDVKRQGGGSKAYLKMALSSEVESSILKRSKQGFAPPLSEWVKGALKEDFETCLESLECKWSLLDATVLRGLFGEHLSGVRDHRRKLWVLYALEKGLENLQGAAG